MPQSYILTLSCPDTTGIPFHHLPVTRATKMEQEAAIWRLVQETGSELVVLARAVRHFIKDRILANGRKTVAFTD